MKEAEMRDHAKLQGREIAKKRLEANYKRNEMEAISSADFAHNVEEIPAKSIAKSEDKSKDDTSSSTTIKKTFEPPKENSFQKMLQESEIKSVKKK